MKTIKKYAAYWMLSALLLLGNVSVNALAAEVEENIIENSVSENYDGNIHIEHTSPYGTVSEIDIVRIPDDISLFASSDSYLTVDEAVAELRQFRKDMVTDFTINVKMNDCNKWEEEIWLPSEIHTGNPFEGDFLKYTCAGYTGSGGYYVGGNGQHYLTLDISAEYYITLEQKKELEARIEATLSGLQISSKTHFDKIKTIYNFITKQVTYDYEHLYSDTEYPLMFTSYAALINGTSVCQGYAVLLYQMLLYVGVDCRIVTGMDHAWNLVKADDKYYWMDATWDDDANGDHMINRYFLKGSDNFKDHIASENWNYYNISNTDFILKETNIPDGFVKIDGRWLYYKDNMFQNSVTDVILGTVENVEGLWYVNNGVVDVSKTGVLQAGNGWYCFKDGQVDSSKSGAHEVGGVWYYFHNGAVDVSKTGVLQAGNGWYYFKDGQVDSSKSGAHEVGGIWYYFHNGAVDVSKTGVLQAGNSWYYFKGGKVEKITSVEQNSNGWWYIKDGKVDFGYTGTASNQNGTWYILNGKVDFSKNGVLQAGNGWYYFREGKVDFGYTGIASNQNGTWYILNGKVDFSKNGEVTFGGIRYKITNGRAKRV